VPTHPFASPLGATLAAAPDTTRTAPGFPLVIGVLMLLCAAAFVTAYRRQWSPPLAATVAVALGLRLVVLGFSYGHTPHDVASYFKHTGDLVLAGHNPATGLPRFQWNFLPLMPYVYALEIKTGLPWQLGGKIAPILADAAIVLLLARLAPARHAGTVALLYALCPLAILVSAQHGQVEPVALALGLGALLYARRGADLRSGLLAGLAVATKTWPVLLAVGVFRQTPPRRWWRVAAPLAVVLAVLLASVRLFLHDSMHAMVHTLTSYRSYVGTWGWAGVLGHFHVVGIGYTGWNVDSYQKFDSVLMALAVAAVIALFWRAGAVALTASLLLAFLAVTAGFGVQYLLWPAPFVLLLRRPSGMVFAFAASVYAAFVYLIAIPATTHGGLWLAAQRWGSLPLIACAVAAMPWALRRAGAGAEPEPGDDGEGGEGGGTQPHADTGELSRSNG